MSLPFIRRAHQPNDDDYYLILDVDFNASQETIVSAYRSLARKFHPDKNNQDERSRKEAEIIFEKIKNAYDVLKDPRKRQIYDTLGPDGLKMDGWKLAKKQMTAQELRDEFLRFQQQEKNYSLAVIAKPVSSFTMNINASDLFNRNKLQDQMDDDYYEAEGLGEAIIKSFPSLEISSMSASMAVENYSTVKSAMTLNGSITTSNGTGDGSLGATYKYNFSKKTDCDLTCQIGNRPMVATRITHQISDKTSITARGFLVVGAYCIVGGRLTLSHRIRKNLKGTISYREGINTSVTTSLIYLNEKLMFQVTTSYKLSRLHQTVSVDLAYNCTHKSKLSISLAASSNQGVAVEYGAETRIFEINAIGAALSVSVPSGITLKLRFNRANQEFILPIYLSDEIYSAPVFYGTVMPLIGYYLFDRCYLRNQKQTR